MTGSRRTLYNTAHPLNVVVVETPTTVRKVFQLQFTKNGTVFVSLPYFPRKDGFVTQATRYTSDPNSAPVEYLKHGKVTSHAVKLSYPADGNVHFSQDGKVRTLVRKKAVPLRELRGPLFHLRVEGLREFAEVKEGDRESTRGVRLLVGAQIPDPIDSIWFTAHWFSKQHLLSITKEKELGPYVKFRTKAGDVAGAILGRPDDWSLAEYVVFLTHEIPVRRAEISEPHLLLIGGFDHESILHEPDRSFSFLMAAYPQSVVEGASTSLLPSIDFTPMPDGGGVMPTRRPRAIPQCAYCGDMAVTDDHIPPKNLFGDKSGLITVPSCRDCNLGASKDDEYFRLALAFHEDVGNHPEAAAAVASVKRSLSRPEAEGFLMDFVRRTEMEWAQREGGLWYLRTTTDVDEERISRVVERITRGLYWGARGARLPDEYCVEIASKEGIRHQEDGLTKAKMVKAMVELAKEPAYGVRDGRVFYYMYKFWDPDDPNVAAWLMVFFERFMFLAATRPKPLC